MSQPNLQRENLDVTGMITEMEEQLHKRKGQSHWDLLTPKKRQEALIMKGTMSVGS